MKLRFLVVLLLIPFLFPASLREPQKPSPDDDAGRRAEWFLRGRQSLDRESPAAHRLEAIRQRRRLPVIYPQRRQRLSVYPGTGDWTELGPRPEIDPAYQAESGRFISLALDPSDATGNTVYAGAAFGGVWKSTNALSSTPTFTPISDPGLSLAAGAIAVDPSNPNKIFVGTGEESNGWDSYDGTGILYSTDGGGTWTSVTSADAGAHPFLGLAFADIVVDPTNSNLVVACAGNSSTVGDATLANSDYRGVYASTDGGQTWSRVFSVDVSTPGDNGYSCTNLIYEPTQKIYYAAIRGNGFYASSTPAVPGSWTALSSPFANGVKPSFSNGSNFHRATMATRGGTLWAIIADGNGDASTPTPCTAGQSSGCDTGLVQSTDGGKTWTPINLPPGNLFLSGSSHQGTYDQYVAAPPGSTSLVVAGIDTWSTASPNGTATQWTNLTNAYSSGNVHPDQHAIAMLNATTWFIANDGGVWSTTHAGAGWQDENGTIGAIQFLGVTGDPSQPGVYLGGSQDNSTAQSTNAPSSLQWNYVTGGDGGYTAIDPANPANYYAEDAEINIYASADSGQNWHTVVDKSTINDGSSQFYLPYELVPSNTSEMVLGTCRVWEGPAQGPNGSGWKAISPYLTPSQTCTSQDPYISALAVAPSSADTIVAGTVAGDAVITNNATSSSPAWTPITPSVLAPNTPIGAVAIAPGNPQTIYLGIMDFGTPHVLESTDGGSTWTDITGNLPDAPVNAILIDPIAPQDIYVGTDVGVFVATDGGSGGSSESWMQMGALLPDVPVLGLSLDTAGNVRDLIAATHGRGAWRIGALSQAGVQLSAQSTSGTASAPGQSATYTLTLTPAGGFSGTVNLACSGLPLGTNCAFSPSASPSVGGGAASQIILTVSTAAAGLTAKTLPTSRWPTWPWMGIGAVLALFLFAFRRRRWAGLATLGMLALLATGCGSGSSGGGGQTSGGTPTGTYTIQVTATAGAATQSLSLTLTVG